MVSGSIRAKLILTLATLALGSEIAGAAVPGAAKLKKEAASEVGRMAGELATTSEQVWRFAETGLREQRSAALLADRLAGEGFVVERGVAQMPTAFVATYGSGAPVVAILAEYDALPGVGNEAAATRLARADGTTSGHGCGHNLLGTAALGGAIALKRVMATHHLQGTIKVFGTPAEEDDIGKLYMAKAGVFNGIDAAIEWHPYAETGVNNGVELALNNFQFEFFGKSAHASAEPEKGRSALHALEMTTFGLNLLREHVPSTVRMHYYVAEGGVAPNIVPDYTRLVLNVRDVSREGVDAVYERVLKIVDGAAHAMEVDYKVTMFSALNALLLNRPLQEAMQTNLDALEPLRFSADDQEFGRRLQAALHLEPSGFDGGVKPLAAAPVYAGGSTDVAEVSRIAPTVGFQATSAPVGTPWHSWAATASHGSPAARKTVEYAAKVIARMGIDLLTDHALLARAKQEFLRSTGGKPYVAGIPTDQKPPLDRATAN